MNLEEAIKQAEQNPNNEERVQLAKWLKELLLYRDIIWGIDLYNIIEFLYLNKFKGRNIRLPIDKPIK